MARPFPTLRAAIILAALLLTSCAAVRPSGVVDGVQTGVASWYGDDFHGRPTASGERYDMHAMTAAHRTLPLGTIVDVTNLDNGRSARVTINDRGPFVDGRVIDLSYSAAKRLDMVGPGTARVRLKAAGRDQRYVRYMKVDESGAGGSFAVQLGAFTERENAERLRTAISWSNRSVRATRAVVNGRVFYRVRVGPFMDRSAAVRKAEELAAEGYEAVLMRE